MNGWKGVGNNGKIKYKLAATLNFISGMTVCFHTSTVDYYPVWYNNIDCF